MINILLWLVIATPSLKEAGRWGFGPALSVELKDGLVFAGVGSGLYVIEDRGDSPEILLRKNLRSNALDIVSHDDLLIVAEDKGGIEVLRYDGRGLDVIQRVKTNGSAYRLNLSGDTLMVALRDGGIQLFRLTDRGLRRLRTILSRYEISSVLKIRGFMAVAASDSGLFICKNGHLVDSSKFEDSVEDIDKLDDSTIIATVWNGIVKVIRITDTGRISVVSSVPSDNPRPYFVAGTLLNDSTFIAVGYTSDVTSGIMGVVDLSDVRSPRIVTHEFPMSYLQDMATVGDTVYLACDYGGIRKVVLSGSEVFGIWHLDTPGYAIAGAPLNDSLIASAGKMGKIELLKVKGKGDKFRISEVALHNMGGEIHDAVSVDGYLYMAGGTAGLLYADVKGLLPHNFFIDTLAMDGILRKLTIDTSSMKIYTANEWGGAHIVDVTRPWHPGHVYEFELSDTAGYVSDVEKSGKYYYLLSMLGNLMVYDREKPDHIVTVTSIGAWGYDMEISSNLIFVAADDSGLVIFKISGDSLKFVKKYALGGFARSVLIKGDYAFVVGVGYDYESGWLAVLDVRDPGNPKMIQRIPLPGLGEKITYWPERNLFVVASFNSGLIFYEPRGFGF